MRHQVEQVCLIISKLEQANHADMSGFAFNPYTYSSEQYAILPDSNKRSKTQS